MACSVEVAGDAHRTAVHRAHRRTRRGAVGGIADARPAGGRRDGHRGRGGEGARRRVERRGGALDGIHAGGHGTVGQPGLIGDGLQRGGRGDAHRAAVHRAHRRTGRGAVGGVADARSAGGGRDGHRGGGGEGARHWSERRRGALNGVDPGAHATVGVAGLIGDSLQRRGRGDGSPGCCTPCRRLSWAWCRWWYSESSRHRCWWRW